MEMRKEQEPRKKAVIPKPLKGMPMPFDYKYIPEDHLYVKQKTNELLSLLKSKGTNVFEIGKILIDVKKRLKVRVFISWVETEIGMSKGVAQRHIRIVERFGDEYPNIKLLPYSTLHELSGPSTPQSLIDMIESGKIEAKYEVVRRMKAALLQQDGHVEDPTIQDLINQLAQMQQQISNLPPEIQIKEVEVIKYVTPPEVQEELATLRKELEKYYAAWEEVIKDKKAAIEENKKITQERDVLLENWKAISKNNKHMKGKIDSLTSLIQSFHDEYSQIQNANALIVESTISIREKGDN